MFLIRLKCSFWCWIVINIFEWSQYGEKE
jgi:hypothetical protein